MHEKENRDKNLTGNSFDKKDSQRKEPGNNIDGPGTTYVTAQSMQSNPTTAKRNIKSNLNILDKYINESKEKLAILSKVRSQLDNKKKFASAKKAIKNKLIHGLGTAKRALVNSLQEELWDQIESEDTENKFREDTIRQLIWFLRENELHVLRLDDWTEPAIPISVLQSLAISTQDNLQTVCGLINKTSKAAQEEEHATLELKNCMENEYKNSQQT